MPPLDDNEIEELEPSTSSTLDAEAKVTEPSPDDANSSDATGDTDDSLLSVVRDVVTESRKDQTASPAEGEEDGQTADDLKPKEDAEDYSDVPFNKHPRFQQLLRKAKANEAEATQYRNVQGFLDRSGLSSEEAADGLIIMAMMKTDPVEAWKRLKPRVQTLLVAAGEVLPDDLQQRVTAGEMSRDAAMEVSRARAGVQSVQVRQSFEQQQAQRRQQNEAASALTGAATTWGEDRRRKDPNFDVKLVPLQKEILFLQQTEGKPTTPDGVKAQLAKAYKAVNDALPKPAAQTAPPRKPAIRPITGGQVAGGQKPESMSTIDIVRANRRSA